MRLVRRRSLVRAITSVGVAAIITLARSTSSAHTNTTQVTWAVDVAPIVRERCAGCHRANGFGPMPLTTYDEAKRWAATIRDEVLSGRMPPWFAAPGFGNFSNDASLTPVEIEMLARWANGGAPAGPDSVATPSAAANGARTSALRVQFSSVNVAGASTERFELPLDLKGDRWVTGWEFQPGNATVVEHASIAVAPAGTPLGSWTPLDGAITFPPHVGQRLPHASRLSVDVRYRKTAEPQIDRSSLTLFLGAQSSRELRHRLLACGAERIDNTISIVAVNPRASAAGESVEVVARHRDAAIEPLAVVKRWEPAYPITYRMRAPVRVERGSRLEIRSSAAGCGAVIDYFVTPAS
jgi:hypothetical protein